MATSDTVAGEAPKSIFGEEVLSNMHPQILPLCWVIILSLCLLYLTALFHRMKRAPVDQHSLLGCNLPEPPSLLPWIPYIGHALAIKKLGHRYYNSLCSSTPLSIFTLPLMSERIIIAKPEMERLIATRKTELSLWHFVFQTLIPMMLSIPHAKFDRGFTKNTFYKVQNIFHRAFLTRENLKNYVEPAVENIEQEIRKIDRETVHLGEWVSLLTTKAVALAVWGPKSPWMNDDLLRHFKNFTSNVEALSSPFPEFTAPSVVRSRRIVLDTLSAHYATFDKNTPSAMIGEIQAAVTGVKFAPDDRDNIAMPHVMMAMGMLNNIAGCTEWLVHYLFSCPQLMLRVRAEAEQLVDDHGVIQIERVRQCCPWLVATWYEVLRLHTNSVVRGATEDIELDGKHHISKDTTVVLPQTAWHWDEQTWGADAAIFRPERFFGEDGKVSFRLVRKLRAFGIDGALCPGRHMSFTVSMAIMVTMLLTLEIEIKDGLGWQVPKPKWTLSVGFESCNSDQEVVLSKGDQWKGIGWSVRCGDAMANNRFK